MVRRVRTAPLPGGLTVEDASVRAATVYGGWKAAKGVVVTGDAVAGLSQHDIYLALTQQDLLKLSPQSAEEAARWIKDVASSGVVRYLFIGVGGGVLTFAALRAVNPKMPVGRALLIAVGVVVGLVTLLLLLEAKGVLVAP